jgi:hypothetical protein
VKLLEGEGAALGVVVDQAQVRGTAEIGNRDTERLTAVPSSVYVSIAASSVLADKRIVPTSDVVVAPAAVAGPVVR